MSDLAATNCGGCTQTTTSGGCNCMWIILILLFCGGWNNNDGCGNDATARCRELFPRCASCGNAGPVQAVALRLKINPTKVPVPFVVVGC